MPKQHAVVGSPHGSMTVQLATGFGHWLMGTLG
jgi:hypothetical protein